MSTYLCCSVCIAVYFSATHVYINICMNCGYGSIFVASGLCLRICVAVRVLQCVAVCRMSIQIYVLIADMVQYVLQRVYVYVFVLQYMCCSVFQLPHL